jgi:hypothetical protein
LRTVHFSDHPLRHNFFDRSFAGGNDLFALRNGRNRFIRCFVLLIFFSFLLLCDSPYDNPFENSKNAKGEIRLTSENGNLTNSIFIDSTGHEITVTATIFLLKFIKSVVVTVNFEDSTSDTILDSLFTGNESGTVRSLSEKRVVHQGGKIVFRISVQTTDGVVSTDSAVSFLYSALPSLTMLSIDDVELSPKFNKKTRLYSTSVFFNKSAISLRLSVSNSDFRVIINNEELSSIAVPISLPLNVGKNSIVITLIDDQNNITNTYAIDITRENESVADSHSVALSHINLSAGFLDKTFNPDTLFYHVMLAYDDSVISITPIPSDTTVAMVIDNKNIPAMVTPSIGIDTVNIVVTTPGHRSTRTYSLIFNRVESNNAALMQLISSSGTLFPDFSSTTTNYSLMVTDTVSSLRFTTVPLAATATVTINDLPSDSSFTLPSTPVTTPFNVVVTAPDKSYTLTYAVSVTRAGSDLARCVAIEPSWGTLIPPFHYETGVYDLRISSDISEIKIKPTAAHNRSTITVNGTSVISANWSSGISCAKGNKTTFSIIVSSESKSNQKNYQITVNRAFSLTMDNSGKGSVAPSGTTNVYTAVPLSINAQPDSGYYFSTWKVVSGDATINNPISRQTSVIVQSDAAIQALFSLNRYYLTINNNGSGSVSHSDSVNHGVPYPITAAPADGFFFLRWQVKEGSAEVNAPDEPSTTVMLRHGNATIEAIFTKQTYQLSVRASGKGQVRGSATVAQSLSSTIIATANTGYHFSIWHVEDGVATIADSAASSTTAILSSGNASIVGFFEINKYTLSLAARGNGTVTGPANGTSQHGIPVTVSAYPTDAYHFHKWRVTQGTASIKNPDSATTTVTLSSGNATVEAIFTTQSYKLTVDALGHGKVTGSGIVAMGIDTAITATPDSGYHFTGWTVTTGAAKIANADDDTTIVTLSSGNATVTASFAINTYRLITSVGAHGSGTVKPIDLSVDYGTRITIVAKPATGYQFGKWNVKNGSAIIADSLNDTTTALLKNGNVEIEALFNAMK